MMCVGASSSTPSNSRRSTRVARRENTLKLTPSAVTVAPSGALAPAVTSASSDRPARSLDPEGPWNVILSRISLLEMPRTAGGRGRGWRRSRRPWYGGRLDQQSRARSDRRDWLLRARGAARLSRLPAVRAVPRAARLGGRARHLLLSDAPAVRAADAPQPGRVREHRRRRAARDRADDRGGVRVRLGGVTCAQRCSAAVD